MKKKLLIIQLDQFGYLTDSYKWCEYLTNEYSIEVVCYDSKRTRFDVPNVKVHYVNLSKYRVIHALHFFAVTLLNIIRFKGKIWVIAFPKCHILKRLIPWKRMHLDIRTVSVSKNQKEREQMDLSLHQYASIFDSISIISQGAKERLKIEHADILPLGSDILSKAKKDYSSLDLLYIGTLKYRDIHKTIKGCQLFHERFPGVSFHYHIIGDGPSDEGGGRMSDQYRKLIRDINLEAVISIHGALPYNELTPFIDKSSYGVSFVPVTPWYDVQPPTKTFEYALSGLYVIATNTSCNKEIITSSNGVLITDTEEDFARSLEYIMRNNKDFNECDIRESLIEYSWDKLIDKYLRPIL